MPRLAFVTFLIAVLFHSGPACEAEAGARRSRPVRTGQTMCYDNLGVSGTVIPCAGTAQDGELLRGEPRAYEDNGDGTIRDKRTALMWEKLSNDGSIHEKGNTYTWAQAFGKIDDLNSQPCFAGFCDWRLPNVFELETLRDMGTHYPAVAAPFNTNCGAHSVGNSGCTVMTCSCTYPNYYWTSTTVSAHPEQAWFVDFNDGIDFAGSKTGEAFVRAVRGGS